MTLEDFDRLRNGDGIELKNPVTGHTVLGVVRRIEDDQIRVQWEDGEKVTWLRHEVRIFQSFYSPFKVLKW